MIDVTNVSGLGGCFASKDAATADDAAATGAGAAKAVSWLSWLSCSIGWIVNEEQHIA